MLILHYIASLTLFIIYTFIRPPPLTSSSYEALTPEVDSTEPKKSSKGAAGRAGFKKSSSAANKGPWPGPVHWLVSLPRRIYKSVSEEEQLR